MDFRRSIGTFQSLNHPELSSKYVFCCFRICPTRTVTGTRTVSTASSASAHWWTSLSPPKTSSCCAPSAILMSTPPNAMSARRPSCLVRDSSLWEELLPHISRCVFLYSCTATFFPLKRKKTASFHTES